MTYVYVVVLHYFSGYDVVRPRSCTTNISTSMTRWLEY